MFTTTTTRPRQLRRLIGLAAVAVALAGTQTSAALADGAAGGAGSAGPSLTPKASGLPAQAKKVKPSGRAARSHAKNLVIGGEEFGVFDEIFTRYAWQRLPSGYWVRASRVFHHVSLGGEYGYLWDYWNGSQAVTYALCLPSSGCRAY